MQLFARTPSSNTYLVKETKEKIHYRSIIRQGFNVAKDLKGNLVPMDNRLLTLDNHPFASYGVCQGHCDIGFHNKLTNKYGCRIKLLTGETLTKKLIDDPVCMPSIIDDCIIQWKYGNGSWIREYFTEKHIKEIMYQKKGQVIKFEYTLNGLTVKKEGNKFEFYKTLHGRQVKTFAIQRPYYCKQNGEFINYVPISWEKIGNKWVVIYPSPSTNKYIDPILTFGLGAGQIGGDHKDNTVRSDVPNFALGADVELQTDADKIQEFLMRFSLVGHIPTNAIINTALLGLYSNGICPANLTITVSRMITNWGVTLVNEGINQNPAAQSQPTWNRAFANPTNTPWAGGAAITAADYGAPIFTFDCANADPAATLYEVDIAAGVLLDILDDTSQYGYHFESDNNGFLSFRSQNSVNAATRPSLTVDYTLPAVYPSGTVVFGRGNNGMVTDNHKDSYIDNVGPNMSLSTDNDMILVNDGLISDYPILRFSLIGHIPDNAVLISAILTLTLEANSGGVQVCNIHRLLTDWGVTPIDEGVSEIPATGGQATWDNSHDFNGFGDIGWNAGIGVGFGLGDYIGAAETAFNIGIFDVAGTQYNIDILNLVNFWLLDDVINNLGLVIIPVFDPFVFNLLASQNNPNGSRRPYLTVTFAIPAPLTIGIRKRSTRQYKIFARSF